MTKPVYPAVNNQQAVDLNILNSNVFHNIVNGDATTDVQTYEGNGTVPSVLKALTTMVAYKAPIDWQSGSVENDILQPRVYTNLLFVPIKVPAPMGDTPTDSHWKLYMTDVSSLLTDKGYNYYREVVSGSPKRTFTVPFDIDFFPYGGADRPQANVFVNSEKIDMFNITYVDNRNISIATPVAVGAVVEIYSLTTASVTMLEGLKEETIVARNEAIVAKNGAQQAETNAQTSASSALASKNAAAQSAVDAAAQIPLVTAEGTRQVGIVQSQGNTQVTRVVNEGEAQVQRINAISSIFPVGGMCPFPVNRQPPGWEVVMGQTLQRSVYPEAVTFLTGDTTTPSFTLPDLRGEFVRGADLGRGIDIGRTIGSWQDSQNKAHNHGGGAHTHWSGNSQLTGHSRAPETSSGRNRPDGSSGGGYEGTTSSPKEGNFITTDGGADARPRNVALVWCIKLFHSSTTTTEADINAVMQQLNTMAQAVNPNVGKFSSVQITYANGQPLADHSIATVLTTSTANGPLNVSHLSGPAGWGITEAGTYRVELDLPVLANGDAYAVISVMHIRSDVEYALYTGIDVLSNKAWRTLKVAHVGDFDANVGVFFKVQLFGAGGTIHSAYGRATITRLR